MTSAPRSDLRPATTAVVVVECQHGVVGPESVLPELAADAEGLVPRVAALLDAARTAGVTVVHATFEGSPGPPAGTAPLWRALGPRVAEWVPGARATRPLDELFADGDVVLPRRHGLSPTRDTGLIPVLRDLGVRTVVLAGVSVNVALILAASELAESGTAVVVARDAVAGTPRDYADAALRHTIAMLAEVADVEQIATAW